MKKQLILFVAVIGIFHSAALASTVDGVIDPQHRYAWSKNSGWLNFAADQGNIHVTDSGLTGYVWSGNAGWINLSPLNSGQQVRNDGEGNLLGFAWGESVGWLGFSGVTIDWNGLFHGTSTSTAGEVFTFDCDQCSVKTDWRPASARRASPPLVGGVNTGSSGGGGGGGSSFIPVSPAAIPPVTFQLTPPKPPLAPASIPTLTVPDVLRTTSSGLPGVILMQTPVVKRVSNVREKIVSLRIIKKTTPAPSSLTFPLIASVTTTSSASLTIATVSSATPRPAVRPLATTSISKSAFFQRIWSAINTFFSWLRSLTR